MTALFLVASALTIWSFAHHCRINRIDRENREAAYRADVESRSRRHAASIKARVRAKQAAYRASA